MPTELGEFLRARRTDAALRPSTDGAAGRRRISGLRREEVAAAAGISVDYYTRLEQGRERHPSDAVIAALARVLRLSADGSDHLARLRDADAPAAPGARTAQAAPADGPALADRMAAIVEALRPNPAYVLDRLSNVVAANAEGLALHDGLADIDPAERNTCRYLLLDARAPEVFVEWEALARGAVAHLRAANAADLHEPRLEALVTDLRARSARFDAWWSEHLVERRRTSVTHIRTRDGEVVARRFEVLHLPEDDLRLTLWLPALRVAR